MFFSGFQQWATMGAWDTRSSSPGVRAALPQRFKQFVSLYELRVTLANDFDFHGLERFLSGNAIEPTLKRKLFVVGEIEPNEHANVRGGVLFVRFGVLPTFCGCFFLSGVLPFSGIPFGGGMFFRRMFRRRF